MEINSKQLLAIAAIGAAAWYLLRKGPSTTTGAVTPAAAPARPGGGIWDGFGVGADLYTSLNQNPAPTTNQKAPVPAGDVGTTKPDPYTPPASGGGGGGAVWGASGSTPGFTGIVDGRRTYADGSSSALTDNERDLFSRGILGGPYVGTHNAGAAPPAGSSGGSSGAVWGARG